MLPFDTVSQDIESNINAEVRPIYRAMSSAEKAEPEHDFVSMIM